ncbi:ABC transporter B family member 21-like isoform X2 [Mercurialis annua]|uniref:ABC transporter B family member 21-like isoform X2 n=1 Tax=Mercurialis annua TaxID=3986 RepID=UPI0024AC86CD|nr:ABC transporter B family member 21-like isoform X2 [Mercurialis annua]
MTGENSNDKVCEASSNGSKENEKTVPYYKLFSFADSIDMLLMTAGTIGAFGNGISLPLLPLLLGRMVDSFGSNQSNKNIVHIISKVSLQFVYLAIGAAAASFLQVTCWMVTGERQATRIRGYYLKTILRQDIAFFDTEMSTGEIIGRMSGDTVLIQDAMGEKVGKFLQLMAAFFGGFIIAFSKGWMLALALSPAIPIIVLFGAISSICISKMAARGQNSYAEAATVVEQTIGSIRTVASFTGEKRAINDYNMHLQTAYKSGVREGVVAGIGFGAVVLVIVSTFGMAVWFGAKMILEKGYTGGQVVSVVLVVLTSSMSLGRASPSLRAFAAGQAAAYKMFETINRKSEIDAYDTNGRVLDDIHGNIELREVYFRYPARADEEILSGFSLFIPSGSTAALVGQSGSGKSTIISLIERFYDPQSGGVFIDGINLKEFQLKWIREKIGLVSQEPALFTCSVKDNIAYGKDGATLEEIRAAVELANAAKFIEKLPQGLDTMVGEHGTQFSGGQKQRIAIARAILKNPTILLLDEATSALDAESERIVQHALDRVMNDRTTVIVAHRLTTVRNVDTIIVIHQGKIVEKGTHQELLEDPEGEYSKLIRLQEVNNETKQAIGELNKSEISIESIRQSSSQRRLLQCSSSSYHESLSFSCDFPSEHCGHDLEKDLNAFPLKEQIPEVSIYSLAYLNKPELPILIVGTITASINGTILTIYGVLISKAIKTFFKPPHELREDSKFWALMFMTLGLIKLAVHPLRSYLFSIAGSKLVQRIRSICFERVVYMEIGWFDDQEHSSGAIGARLSADAAAVQVLVGDALAELVQNIATIVIAMIFAFTANWQLAFVILAMIPMMCVNTFLQVKSLKGFSADANIYEEASQVANDAVRSIRTIASFCAEEKVIQLYGEKCEGPKRTGLRIGLISGVGFGVSSFFLFVFYAISFYVGALLIEGNHTTFADVFQVFFALTMAATGISHSSSIGVDTAKVNAAVASVFRIIHQKSMINPSDESGTILQNVRGDIELHCISFKYPSRPDIQIFQDLSLAIHSGKTVALVGESGSGKSTVIALLQRFYDPDSGHITLDGVKIQMLQLKWFRQQMGLVSQEPVLFNDTIRANIAYGKEGNVSEAEIIAAAELANAHKFISSLQQGYETMVGERGIQLSGGQKQRVAIARAIVKCPKILLLDEATSALDVESERVVQDALDRIVVNRTTVVVAHRLSTIKNADVIAVLSNGFIVEKGSHEELINNRDGFYASLVALHMTAKT